jgi:hypothetical protein
MTEAANQIVKDTEFINNSTTSDQADNSEASRPLKKWIAVPMPPGMTEEQYWERKKLAAVAAETAKNTEFNKNITISDQAIYGPASPPSNMKKKVSMSPLA